MNLAGPIPQNQPIPDDQVQCIKRHVDADLLPSPDASQAQGPDANPKAQPSGDCFKSKQEKTQLLHELLSRRSRNQPSPTEWRI